MIDYCKFDEAQVSRCLTTSYLHPGIVLDVLFQNLVSGLPICTYVQNLNKLSEYHRYKLLRFICKICSVLPLTGSGNSNSLVLLLCMDISTAPKFNKVQINNMA